MSSLEATHDTPGSSNQAASGTIAIWAQHPERKRIRYHPPDGTGPYNCKNAKRSAMPTREELDVLSAILQFHETSAQPADTIADLFTLERCDAGRRYSEVSEWKRNTDIIEAAFPDIRDRVTTLPDSTQASIDCSIVAEEAWHDASTVIFNTAQHPRGSPERSDYLQSLLFISAEVEAGFADDPDVIKPFEYLSINVPDTHQVVALNSEAREIENWAPVKQSFAKNLRPDGSKIWSTTTDQLEDGAYAESRRVIAELAEWESQIRIGNTDPGGDPSVLDPHLETDLLTGAVEDLTLMGPTE